MDAYRFFVPELGPQTGEAIALPEEEAHHARAVLRLETGAAVELFDGKGRSVAGRVAAVGKRGVTVERVGEVRAEKPPALELTLAVAIPKADRAEVLVEQASQLEVAAIQWLDTDRSVVKPREGGTKLAKWRRLAVESAKQCGRSRVLEIREPRTLLGLLGELPHGLVLWLEPRDDPATRPLLRLMPERGTAVTALIGPEGGWSERERAMLEGLVREKRVHRVVLTRTVLRIETAAAAVGAILLGES